MNTREINAKEDYKSLNKKHLLNRDSFSALLELQQEIAQETGWQPSLNKMVNTLINQDTLFYLKETLMSECHNRMNTEASTTQNNHHDNPIHSEKMT